MIIAIDFDGTITYGDKPFPECGTIRPEAKDVMKKLKARGHKIIINTCRVFKSAENAKNYLIENDIPFDTFNENLPERIAEFNGFDCRKISADVYFDDRAYGCAPINWNDFYEYILKKESDYITRLLENNFIGVKWYDEYKTWEITSAFLDSHNDHIQVYIEQLEDNKFRVHDDSFISFESKLKNIPMFIGTSKFVESKHEIYTIAEEKNLANAVRDMLVLMVIASYRNIIMRGN